MELTGKCKEDFEKWFGLEFKQDLNKYVTWAKFDILYESAQHGVYVDFFLEKGFYFDSSVVWDCGSSDKVTYMVDIKEVKELICLVTIEENTLQEAREESIKQANKIYNESNK